MTVLDRPAHRPVASAAGPRRATHDAAVRRVATSLLGGAVVLVTWWWVRDGAPSDLTGWGSALTGLGRWTGLVASLLLLTQVFLMARMPVLERAFGQDRLAHLHRWTGFGSFTLMVAHVVLITWGYAAGSLLASPATLWDLTIHYPGMLLAAAGTLCLVMVVVTSIKAARRRLRFESWHLLHLYAYLGVGLALPHQLWTGKDLTASTARTVFWWSVWAAAAVAVLVWRLALPLARTVRHRVRVVAVVPETPGVVSVYLTGRHLDRLGARAGQFLTWRFLDRPGWTRANPFSLSAAPRGHSLRITVQDVGDGSRSLSTLRPGTRVLVEGPHGRLTERVRTRPGVVLIGAGVGMAPLRALAEGLTYADGDAVLVHRYARDELFAAELAGLQHTRGLRVVRLPGRRRHPRAWTPPTYADGSPLPGSDLDALRSWVPDVAERDVFVCGPQGWVDLVRADLRRAGVPDRQVHVESFGW